MFEWLKSWWQVDVRATAEVVADSRRKDIRALLNGQAFTDYWESWRSPKRSKYPSPKRARQGKGATDRDQGKPRHKKQPRPRDPGTATSTSLTSPLNFEAMCADDENTLCVNPATEFDSGGNPFGSVWDDEPTQDTGSDLSEVMPMMDPFLETGSMDLEIGGINPANGLPMFDGGVIDVAGNPYGMDSHDPFGDIHDAFGDTEDPFRT